MTAAIPRDAAVRQAHDLNLLPGQHRSWRSRAGARPEPVAEPAPSLTLSGGRINRLAEVQKNSAHDQCASLVVAARAVADFVFAARKTTAAWTAFRRCHRLRGPGGCS